MTAPQRDSPTTKRLNMDMLSALTAEVRSELFRDVAAGEVDISDVVSAPPTADFMGITFSEDLRFVLAFLPLDDAGGDVDLIDTFATRWTRFHDGFGLTPESARLIKFFRAGAVAEDLFIPERWPIPKPFNIWHVEEALTRAIKMYNTERPDVTQFFFMPQNGALEKWYARMERSFNRPTRAFLNISRPASDEGGFHGFQSTQSCQTFPRSP